jgi:hypothetical protein
MGNRPPQYLSVVPPPLEKVPVEGHVELDGTPDLAPQVVSRTVAWSPAPVEAADVVCYPDTVPLRCRYSQ